MLSVIKRHRPLLRSLSREELSTFLERKYSSLRDEKPKHIRLILSGAKVDRKARIKKTPSEPKARRSAKQIRQEASELSLLQNLGIDLGQP
jgi:hypothetical protein